ncbi:flavin reductase family protein [Nonomuraea sp. NPDC050786]|uniref:flavin reductase family protein n=1 Tax=Nonomuraea sp. NPDC050786 TaxID=3154840 RepID=UPI0033D2AEE6
MVSTDDFRLLMGRLPTGVVAVTAVRDGEPVGLVVGSFFSVSLHPTLVGFCIGRSSTSWPRIEAFNGRFGANILAADQAAISMALAAPGGDKFGSIDWYPSPNGSPIIRGAVAYLDCEKTASHNAGDHVLIIARVTRFHEVRDEGPLVFYRKGYYSLLQPRSGHQPTALSG